MDPDYTKIYAALIGSSIEEKYDAIYKLHDQFSKSLSKQLRRQYFALDYWQAEEIVGDAFLEILEHAKNSKPLKPHDQYSIVGWLRQFVINKARNFYKSKKNLKTISLSNEELTEEEMLEYLTNYQNNPESPIDLNCYERVIKDFGFKYPEQSEIISDREIRGIGYKELAIKYGKNLSNLKRICSEFRILLEKKMEPCLANE